MARVSGSGCPAGRPVADQRPGRRVCSGGNRRDAPGLRGPDRSVRLAHGVLYRGRRHRRLGLALDGNGYRPCRVTQGGYARERLIAEAAAVHGSADDAEPAPRWWDLLTDRNLMLLTLSYATVNYFQYLFFYWMDHYFLEVLKLSKESERFFSAIPPWRWRRGCRWVAGSRTAWCCPMGPPWGGRLVGMGGLFAGAVLLGLGTVPREPAWIVTWFALSMAAVGATEGPFWATAVSLGGRRGGSAAALLNTGGNLGGLLAGRHALGRRTLRLVLGDRARQPDLPPRSRPLDRNQLRTPDHP